jgi:hypothetical protein
VQICRKHPTFKSCQFLKTCYFDPSPENSEGWVAKKPLFCLFVKICFLSFDESSIDDNAYAIHICRNCCHKRHPHTISDSTPSCRRSDSSWESKSPHLDSPLVVGSSLSSIIRQDENASLRVISCADIEIEMDDGNSFGTGGPGNVTLFSQGHSRDRADY